MSFNKVPWNKGLKGIHLSPNTEFKKGSKFADSHKRKISQALKNRRIYWKDKISIALKGKKRKPMSDECKAKISCANLGKQYSSKGRMWSKARREAQKSIVRTRKLNPKPIIKNGKEYHPYWHNIRKVIYKRDHWICQDCGSHCHNTTKRKIQCHHIDYNENNNNPTNLITLCASCHAKTNFRREDWLEYFNNKVNSALNNSKEKLERRIST